MGTKDWTDTALVECLSDNLPLSGEQRAILIGVVVERAKQDKDADRYRWLRDRAIWMDPPQQDGRMVWCVVGTSAADCGPCDGGELDEAVNTQMMTGVAVGAA